MKRGRPPRSLVEDVPRLLVDRETLLQLSAIGVSSLEHPAESRCGVCGRAMPLRVSVAQFVDRESLVPGFNLESYVRADGFARFHPRCAPYGKRILGHVMIDCVRRILRRSSRLADDSLIFRYQLDERLKEAEREARLLELEGESRLREARKESEAFEQATAPYRELRTLRLSILRETLTLLGYQSPEMGIDYQADRRALLKAVAIRVLAPDMTCECCGREEELERFSLVRAGSPERVRAVCFTCKTWGAYSGHESMGATERREWVLGEVNRIRRSDHGQRVAAFQDGAGQAREVHRASGPAGEPGTTGAEAQGEEVRRQQGGQASEDDGAD
jgi:hypothetical protein